MMDPKPVGLVLVIAGALGAVVSALADPLGIGEGHVFGWLQIKGVIIGAMVFLLGLVIAMEWVPYPGRQARGETVASGSAPQTNIITSSSRRSEPDPD
jgi:hypothetical protein